MPTWLTIVLIVLGVILAVLVAFYFIGSKMQGKQAEQQQLMEASKQTISLLVIDKKKMKLDDAGLPKVVTDQTPWYSKLFKVPIVKAKVGPRVMTLMADPGVFDLLPLKTECKVIVSGIYITKIVSVRGGAVPKAPEKKGLFRRRNKNK